MSKTDYIYMQQQKELEQIQEQKDNAPLSLKERAELDELKRLHKDLESHHPEYLDEYKDRERARLREKKHKRGKEVSGQRSDN